MPETKELKFLYMDYVNVDIELRSKKTVINGKNGTGKSYLWNIISQYAMEENRKDILCLNVDNVDTDDIEYTINKIRKIQDGIIVIDQADNILWNKDLYEHILLDRSNFYIIMSRKYYERYSELAKIVSDKTHISIKYKLNIA